MKNCICKDELMIDKVFVHLAWCPESYFYKEALDEYKNAPWYKRLFVRNPEKYYNFLRCPTN